MKAYKILFLLGLLVLPALADEVEHHEDLTPQQLGTVHFPTSCSPSAQGASERGVALLHSFWYEEAQKSFEQAAKDDPQCAIAHWGIAMSLWHQLWNHPDAPTIKKGLAEVKQAKALHARTARERDYAAAAGAFYSGSAKRDYHARAVAYSAAMERMYRRYPGDHEAAAFYALSLLASERDSDTAFINRKKAAAVLEPLFTSEPDHPGVAHYLIHTYDKPGMAELGLPAARRYAQIAPMAPHAVHMPSHIFARLGLWQEDIASNLASIAATQKGEAMHMSGEGHQFHAMDFLAYAYMQTGREAEARQLIDEIKTMPPMQNMYGMAYDPRIDSLISFNAMYVMELHHWPEAASLAPVAGGAPEENSTTYWARGIGAARSGNIAGAHQDAARLEAIHEQLVKEKKLYPASGVDQELKEATAWIDHAEGRDDDAIKILGALAEKDDGVFEMSDEIPAREMLADLLMEMHRPEQALTEYEADLKMNPNRFNGLYGAARAAKMAGEDEKANRYYALLVKTCGGSTSDRPELNEAKALLAQK